MAEKTESLTSRVPAGEAREGDTVTDTRRGRIVRLPGDRNAMVRWDGNSGAQEVDLDWSRITVSRPVSPLPDQPGAVGTARLYGGEVRRRVFFIFGKDHGYWVDEEGNEYQPEYLSDYEPELPPAGAGVDEGGKADVPKS